jgi:hypothetical protein
MFMRISDLLEESVQPSFAMTHPNRDINVAMRRVKKNPQLKIVLVSPMSGYRAVEQSDPRPAVKPNLDRIAELRRMTAEIHAIESLRNKKYPRYPWQNKPAEKDYHDLGDQIRAIKNQMLKLRETPAHIMD